MLKSIFKDYTTSVLGVLSGLITQLVFYRLLIGKVSMSDFALYAYLFQVAAYFSVLQLGLDFNAMRYISKSIAEKDLESAAYSFVFIKKFNKLMGVLLLFFSLFVGLLIVNSSALPSGSNIYDVMLLFTLFSASLFVVMQARPYVVALNGFERQSIVNISQFLLNLGATILAVGLLMNTELGIFSMPLSLVFTNVVYYLVMVRISRKICRDFVDTGKKFKKNKNINTQLINFSLLTTLGGVCWTVESTADVFLLNSVGVFEMVGIYVMWWRFPQMIFELITKFASQAIPKFTILYAKDRNGHVFLFNRVFFMVVGLIFLCTSGLSILLPSFMHLWLGNEFAVDDWRLLSFLISFLISSRSVGNLFSVVFVTSGRIFETTIVSFFQMLVKVLLGFFLTLKFGLLGLMLSSVISSMISVCYYGVVLFREKMFLYRTWSALILLLVAPCFVFLRIISEHFSVMTFVLFGLVISALSGVTIYFFAKLVGYYRRLDFIDLDRIFIRVLRSSK